MNNYTETNKIKKNSTNNNDRNKCQKLRFIKLKQIFLTKFLKTSTKTFNKKVQGPFHQS